MSNRPSDPSLQGIYLPLRLAYGLVPIVAGLDKYFDLLTQWEKYLPGAIARLLPVTPHGFMLVVGVIEIVAGLIVLLGLARLGGYVVMAWLLSIAVVLVIAGYYDIAVRDIVMALGAYTLATVAAYRGEGWLPGRERAHVGSAMAVAS